MNALVRGRVEEALRRYAAADRTDPFTYARGIAHINAGVVSVSRPASTRDSGYDIPAGTRSLYEAEGFREGRSFKRNTGEVVKYDVQAYRAMVRP